MHCLLSLVPLFLDFAQLLSEMIDRVFCLATPATPSGLVQPSSIQQRLQGIYFQGEGWIS
jgi:hypothetical protein